MNIWPEKAVVFGESWLGGTKIRIILNIVLILMGESLYTNEYPSITQP